MIKKWKGNYKYDSQKSQEIIGHSCTYFTIEMEINEDNTLKGTVKDDEQSGGMKGIGIIYGEVHKNLIYFEKQMPHRSILDPLTGLRESFDDKHPVIYYVGKQFDKNKYTGTWEFGKKWAFLFGFIPFRYCPGKGTWEMELDLN